MIVKSVESQCGLRAWQRLYKYYNRKTLARVLRNYREVLYPTAAKDVRDLIMMVTAWEEKWKRLEKGGSEEHVQDC